jgi:hypothetical protein
MEGFMKRFEEKVREYLSPLEVAEILYDYRPKTGTLDIIIFDGNLSRPLLINVYRIDEEGKKLVQIDNNIFREKTEIPTKKLLEKFLDVVLSDFYVRELNIHRGECYGMYEKGKLLIDRKENNTFKKLIGGNNND